MKKSNEKIKISGKLIGKSGITLIALVITIIVLLILAGVSIAMLTGDNGILNEVIEAKEKTELSQLKEELQLYKLGYLNNEKNFDNINIHEILPSLKSTKYNNNATIKNNKIRIDSKNIKLNDYEKEYMYNNFDYFYLVTYATDKQYNIEIKSEEERTCIISDIYIEAIENKKLILPDYINLNGNSYKVIGNKYLTTSKVWDFSYVFVPETFNTFNNLGSSNNFNEIFFSDGITTLGYGALGGCKELNKIRFPNTLKTISGATFQECKKLKSVKLPESLENIEGQAFIGSGVTVVIMPNSVKKIGNQLFQDCQYLEYVQFSDAITILPRGTFMNSTCKEIKFPSGLVEIGDRALLCSKPDIEIPQGVKKIGNELFNYKTKKIRIPNSVEEIGDFVNDDKEITVYTDNLIVLEYLKTKKVTIKSYAEWNEN